MHKCMICGSMLKESKLKGLVECPSCGFITTDIKLSAEDIKKLYSSGYYNGEEYDNYLRDEKMISHQFNKRLDKIEKVCSGIDKVLEIGCAYGFFLREASKRFGEVEGIDVSAVAVEYAKNELKMNAQTMEFYSEFTGGGTYDLVCLWDTIEHLQAPDKYLDKISEMQNKGGYICITTGDIGSLVAKVRGRKWRQIHPPTHLHYFSTKTLSRLLYNKGYKVIYCSHIPTEVCLSTALYTCLVLKKNHTKIWKVISKFPLSFPIRIKLFDYMFVIAEKV